jgi:hypothetical protein
MSLTEQELHLRDIADVYVQTARTYEHSAIFPQGSAGLGDEEELRILEHIRDLSGEDYFLMWHGEGRVAVAETPPVAHCQPGLSEQQQIYPPHVSRPAGPLEGGIASLGKRSPNSY